MKRPLWFRAKTYGFGWYPATWQGWLVLAIWLVLVIADFYRTDAISHSGSDTLINCIPETAVLTLVLIGICYWAGEKPRWRWGKDDQTKNGP